MPSRRPLFPAVSTALRATAFTALVLASLAATGQTAPGGHGHPGTVARADLGADRASAHSPAANGPGAAPTATTPAGGTPGMPDAGPQAAEVPSVSEAFAPAAVAPGEHSTLTITLANPDLDTPVPGANVVNELPAPLQLIQAAHTCGGGALAAAAGSSRLQLYSATIPPGGCTITAEVAWPRTADGIKACATASLVTNAIAPGPAPGGNRFSTAAGQLDAPALATLGCFLSRRTVSQVPTLGDWARTALAGMMVLLGVVLASRRMPPR
ncbi:MAG: hypothetical protein LWW96_00320 [Acidovorax sp.]|uniref:DUF7933 domain-containing protein n=1 Tax=Acidovorax sp. TaxID=1872122 RepID=UPI0025BD6681|nr:hypothetical protein [Acidovorax sp.]MCE1190576.1 hypothetical protein [Acidovorax sp.]